MDTVLGSVIARYSGLLRSRIADAVPVQPPAESLHEMIQYHLGFRDEQLRPVDAPTGKLLRPTFCLLCAEAVGAPADCAIEAAVAVELLHNFTLIHDDIQDRSPLRRHRPTVWHLWGEALAINAGDALHVRAHLALLRAVAHHPSAIVVTAARLLDECCLAITEGQQLDLSFETRLDVRTDEYLEMIACKTARLFGCAAHLGALLGSQNEAVAERYQRFGAALGMAFQIRDDVLGIWGETELTGKPPADDLFKRKKTLPVILAFERATPVEQERLATIYQQPSLERADVDTILEVLDRVDARRSVEQAIERYTDDARSALRAAEPIEPAATALRSLAETLASRRS